MNFPEKWIWLPRDQYPGFQTTKYTALTPDWTPVSHDNYTVIRFERSYKFDKMVISAELRFSGDCAFQLWCNDEFVASGPVCCGGDFLGSDKVQPRFYANETTLRIDSTALEFRAIVKLNPVKMCEFSAGHGGFMLAGVLNFADGTKTVITTDETWTATRLGAYAAPFAYDARIGEDETCFSEVTNNIWHTTTAPISLRCEEEVFPLSNKNIILSPHDEREVYAEFDKIYAGFLHIRVRAKGTLFAEIACRETDEKGSSETFVFNCDTDYRGFEMHSVGGFGIRLRNESGYPCEIDVSLISTFYPASDFARTTTSDKELNLVLDVCRHTLKFCRQTIHLDSPRHCEPLACTGDYYIETLMTAFSFGDMSLAEFDVLRTADLLRHHDGRMFHTTYSLIWVQMLYDTFMLTGNRELLENCEDALILLLNRFETYMGDNGLVETPPDYMFVDWIYIDSFSLHHPPKALGQTCLNIFLFAALDTASKIFDYLGQKAASDRCVTKRDALKKAVNTLLFDSEKGIYFEGLNTPTPEELVGNFMPQNTTVRYYLKHSNILAACYGICDSRTAASLVDKIMSEEIKGDIQPYFAHFLLEAIFRNGLRDKYTLAVTDRWKEPVKACPKGLAEGFVPPEPTYKFDHSHAWGGTVLYSLPRALTGFEMTRPGFEEVVLSPSLLGLDSATVEIPTPFGNIVCDMKKGSEPGITSPREVGVLRK